MARLLPEAALPREHADQLIVAGSTPVVQDAGVIGTPCSRLAVP